jgi:hypothetical protein
MPPRVVFQKTVTTLLLALAIIGVSGLPPMLGGCGGNQRQKTLRASLVIVDAARDGFVSWDATRQTKIVEAATSREEGQAKLDAYREQRKLIVEGFALVYRALASAATQNDDPSLKAAVRDATKLVEQVEALKGAP